MEPGPRRVAGYRCVVNFHRVGYVFLLMSACAGHVRLRLWVNPDPGRVRYEYGSSQCGSDLPQACNVGDEVPFEIREQAYRLGQGPYEINITHDRDAELALAMAS